MSEATAEAPVETEAAPVYLSIKDIKKADDLKPFDVMVPEWPMADGSPGRVKVRPLNMAQRRNVREVASEPKQQPDGTWGTSIDAELMEVEAIIQGCVEPKFPRGAKEWLLEEKSAGPINRIALAIFRASGLGSDDVGKRNAASTPTQS